MTMSQSVIRTNTIVALFSVGLIAAVAAESGNVVTQYVLEGNASHLETFPSDGRVGACALSTVKVSFAKVRRSDIIAFLRNCNDLTSIYLMDIIWEWDEKSIDRIPLARLSDFKFRLIPTENSHWTSSGHLESIIFFYVNVRPTDGLTELLSSSLEFSIEGRTNEGNLTMIRLSMAHQNLIRTTKIRDQEVWKLLYDILHSFKTFSATSCVLNTEKVVLQSAKEISLDKNDLLGPVATIIFNAKKVQVLKVKVLVDEAVDVALLSSTVRYVSTESISFRYSSASKPIEFLNLAYLEMTDGDVNLKLFKGKTELKLLLFEMLLWDSTAEDIYGMENLSTLLLWCQYVQGCPQVTLELLPTSTQEIVLFNVDVRAGNVSERLKPKSLFLYWCRVDQDVLDNLTNVYPNLKSLGLSIDDVIKPEIFQKVVYTSSLKNLGVGIPAQTPTTTLTKFEELAQTYLNLTVKLENYNSAKDVKLVKNGENIWECSVTSLGSYDDIRRAKILKLFGGSKNIVNTTEAVEALNWRHTVYPTVLYIFIGLALFVNVFVIIVFIVEKSRGNAPWAQLLLHLTGYFVYFVTTVVLMHKFTSIFYSGIPSFDALLPYALQRTAFSLVVFLITLSAFEEIVHTSYLNNHANLFSVRKKKIYISATIALAIFINIPRWMECLVEWNYAADSAQWSSYNPVQQHKFAAYRIAYEEVICFIFVYFIPLLLIIIANACHWKQTRENSPPSSKSVTFGGKLLEFFKNYKFRMWYFFVCLVACASIELDLLLRNWNPEVIVVFSSFPLVLYYATQSPFCYCFNTEYRKDAHSIKEVEFKRKKNTENTVTETANGNAGENIELLEQRGPTTDSEI